MIAALCLLIVLLSGAHFPAGADAETVDSYNAEEIYDLSDNSVFYLRSLLEDGTLVATGTGVVISTDGLAATAYHVISGAERLEGVFNDGRTVEPINVLSYDETTDAALLQLPVRDASSEEEDMYQALPVRKTAMKYGEKVFALGYPFKDTPIITEGIVNTPQAEINGRNRILTSAQVVSGMSGGPLIDRFGSVVGIISGSMRTMDNIHLIISTENLLSLLPATPSENDTNNNQQQ